MNVTRRSLGRCLSLWLALASFHALAQNHPPKVIGEVTLDIDGDGKPDRAVLADNPVADADLYIFLGTGADKRDLSSTPSILKQQAVSGRLYEIDSPRKGSLRIAGRCGGCSNDDETALTIVHRRGVFLVAGFSRSWELRDGSVGRCSINYLSGKGLAARGLNGPDKPMQGRFKPIKLADWSDRHRPRACRP